MSFNPERLYTARVFRNLTISELADKTQVTKQAISQYEKGLATPKADVMFQLVLALGFPKEFFEQSSSDMVVTKTFFRALSSTKKLDLKTQEVKTEMIVEIYNFLANYLDFPTLDIPKIDKDKYDSIEQIADYVRSYWSLGDRPIENMVKLLESKGIIVSSFTVDNRKIDAFTQVHQLKENDEEQYCVVLGNDKQSMVRRNFDAAHELGHIILHNKIQDIENLDKVEAKKLEDEANAFAAAFLLPLKGFFPDLIIPTKLDAYIELKKKWKVSIAAMVMRAKQCNRLTNNQFLYLMKQISYRKWRVKEPYDDIWIVPSPQLFRKAISILIENKVLNGQQIVSELSLYNLALDAREIENLLGLEEGVLSKTQNPAVILSLKS